MRKLFAIAAMLLTLAVVADAGPFRRGGFFQQGCSGGVCPSPTYAAPTEEKKAPHFKVNGVTPVPLDGGPPVDLPKSDVPSQVPKARPIIEAQPKDLPKEEPVENFGMDWRGDRLTHVTTNGVEITPKQAIQMIGSKIPDDTNKFRMVAIGDPATLAAVRTEWAKVEPAVRDRVLTWFVGPEDWSLRDTTTNQTRFFATANPTIYLLAPDGESLHRQDGFTGAEDVEAIRRGIKAYDAKKDKDLRRPSPPDEKKPLFPIIPDVSGKINNGLLSLGAMGAALLFFTRRKES
jgi:hypothetical protein